METDVWFIAWQVARMAYVAKRQATDPSIVRDPDLDKTLEKLASVLADYEDKRSKSVSAEHDFYGINRLTRVYRNLMAGTIDEATAKLDCWQILTCPDSPEYHDESMIRSFAMPTQEEISESGGPQEYAIKKWTDVVRGSHGNYYRTKRAFERNELNDPVIQEVSIFVRERAEFHAAVAEHIL